MNLNVLYSLYSVILAHLEENQQDNSQNTLQKLLKVVLQKKNICLLYETCETQICNSQLVTYSVVMNCCACDCFTRKVELQAYHPSVAKQRSVVSVHLLAIMCTSSCQCTAFISHLRIYMIFYTKFMPHPIAIMI